MTTTWPSVRLTCILPSMLMGWMQSMSDDEITVELPVLQSTFESGMGQLGGTQTLKWVAISSRLTCAALPTYFLPVRTCSLQSGT